MVSMVSPVLYMVTDCNIIKPIYFIDELIMWEITILRETEDGLLCMAPNGDTQWLSHDEYNTMIANRKSLYIYEDER